MKHVFFVHSSITYLSSLAIIKEENINRELVLMISNRYDYPDLPIPVTNLNSKKQKSIIQKLANFNRAKYVDKFIQQNIKNDEFIVYMQLMWPNHKFWVTNPNCAGFHFFEEGMANYHQYDSLELFSEANRFIPWRLKYKKHYKIILNDIINIFRGHHDRIKNLPFWPNCYYNFKNIKYYCFSPMAFQGIPEKNKKVLQFDSIKDSFDFQTDLPDINNQLVWISDNIVRFLHLPVEQYVNAIRKGLDSYFKLNKNQPSKIFIKFHQAESELSRTKTLELFSELGIEYEVIKDGTPMEILFLKASNCTIIGMLSSLLFYAATMGHKVYSASDYLKLNLKFAYENLNIKNNIIKL
jgi:hypothetical protein